MKAVVMSDSHKNFNSIMRIVEKEAPFDLLIHAGDVQQDVDDLRAVWPDLAVEAVVGNNDFSAFCDPYQRVFFFGGKKIFLTHGHQYDVKLSLRDLERAAKSKGADICIFGHTHRAYMQEHEGIFMINPGSTRNSYAVIEIADGKIDANIKEN